MAPRSSHGPAAAGCIAGSESLFGRAPPALSLRRRFRFQGDVSCACFSPPPLRTPRRNASRRLDAATMLRGDVFKRPCYGLRLFHLHSAVKIQPFSPVFPLAGATAKAFCRLSLWSFKEKSINHFYNIAKFCWLSPLELQREKRQPFSMTQPFKGYEQTLSKARRFPSQDKARQV